MSKARKMETAGEEFKALVHSIRASDKYHGYSVLAGEILWACVQNVKPERRRTDRAPEVDFLEIMKVRYPADYFCLARKPRSDKRETVLRSAAKRMVNAMADRKKKTFLTFEGEKYQCSHATVAFRYIMNILPVDVFDKYPRFATVDRELKEQGFSVLKYGENEVKFEVQYAR